MARLAALLFGIVLCALIFDFREPSVASREERAFSILQLALLRGPDLKHEFRQLKETCEKLAEQARLPFGSTSPRLVAGNWFQERGNCSDPGCPCFGPIPCFQPCIDQPPPPMSVSDQCLELPHPAIAFMERDHEGQNRLLSVARRSDRHAVIVTDLTEFPAIGGAVELSELLEAAGSSAKETPIRFSSCDQGGLHRALIAASKAIQARDVKSMDPSILLIVGGVQECVVSGGAIDDSSAGYQRHLAALKSLLELVRDERLEERRIRVHVAYLGSGAHSTLYPSIDRAGCMDGREMWRRGYLRTLPKEFHLPSIDPNIEDFTSAGIQRGEYLQEGIYLEALASMTRGDWLPVRPPCSRIPPSFLDDLDQDGRSGMLGDFCARARMTWEPGELPTQLEDERLSRDLVVSDRQLSAAGVTDLSGRLLCDPEGREPGTQLAAFLKDGLTDTVVNALKDDRSPKRHPLQPR